jgi:hypothetical protein
MFLLRSWAKERPAEFVKSLWDRPRDAVSCTGKCKVGLVLTNIYCPVFRGDCPPGGARSLGSDHSVGRNGLSRIGEISFGRVS